MVVAIKKVAGVEIVFNTFFQLIYGGEEVVIFNEMHKPRLSGSAIISAITKHSHNENTLKEPKEIF